MQFSNIRFYWHFKPPIAKLLADTFNIPQEIILKLLYNAPSAFLTSADTETLSDITKSIESHNNYFFT